MRKYEIWKDNKTIHFKKYFVLTFDYEKTIDKTLVGDYPSYKIRHKEFKLSEEFLIKGEEFI